MLNLVVFQRLSVASFTSDLRYSYEIYEYQLTQQVGFVGVKLFYMENALDYPNHSYETCGRCEAFDWES